MIGTRAPSTMPAELALAMIGEIFRQHVAGLKVRHHQYLRLAGDGGLDAFNSGGLRVDGVVERQRSVEQPTGNLAAICHLAQRRGFNGRGNLGRYRFDGRQNRYPRRAETNPHPEIDRILDDVALAIEVGENVDRRVGDEQGLGVSGHIDHEHVADAPVGAQARRFCGNAAHQFVGMKAALHQQLALGLVDQFHGHGRGGFTMSGVDDFELRDIEIELSPQPP